MTIVKNIVPSVWQSKVPFKKACELAGTRPEDQIEAVENYISTKIKPIMFHPTGSYYMFGKDDTDIDYVLLVKDKEEQVKLLKDNAYSIDAEYLESTSTKFISCRAGRLNLIITDGSQYYLRFAAATELVKKIGLTDKITYVGIFASIFDEEPSKEVIKKFSSPETTPRKSITPSHGKTLKPSGRGSKTGTKAPTKDSLDETLKELKMLAKEYAEWPLGLF